MKVGDYFERRRSQSLSYKKKDTNKNIVKYGKCHQLLAVLIVGINTPHTAHTEQCCFNVGPPNIKTTLD